MASAFEREKHRAAASRYGSHMKSVCSSGASAISIGTANFTDPRVPERIVDGLGSYLAGRNLSSLSDIVGKANVGFANAHQYEGDEG